MTNSSNEHSPGELHERFPEVFTPERTGNGTFDDGWKPGAVDDHLKKVFEDSDPKKPGITPCSKMVDFGGMYVTRDQAILMGMTVNDMSMDDE